MCWRVQRNFKSSGESTSKDSSSASRTRKLLFVVGVWRSGTTLLHGMLNQHPEIALLFEAHHFALWPRNPDKMLPSGWRRRLEFFSRGISRHNLDAAGLPEQATSRTAALALCNAFADSKRANVMGTKAPGYHFRLPEISSVFPNASFIVIWRDPLECCRSVAGNRDRMREMARKGMLNMTLFGFEAMAKGVECLRRMGTKVHEVCYRDLISDPLTELRAICDFIGIDFDDRMLDLKSADRTSSPGLGRKVISSSFEGEELLSPSFGAKVRRYSSLWAKRYPNSGLAKAITLPFEDDNPGKLEQLTDRWAYICWCALGDFRHFSLRYMPLWIWESIRHRRDSL